MSASDMMFFGGKGSGKVPPIPGGFGNPTGTNPGGFKTGGDIFSSTLENFPMFGKIPGTPGFGGGPSIPFTGQKRDASSGLFNFPGNNFFSNNPFNVSGLQVGQAAPWQDPSQLGKWLSGELNDAYGKGLGGLLQGFLSTGAGYNPAVAQALINQMQPLEARGMANIREMFGGSGSLFSSESALAAGDFQSQFAANEQATLANLYQQSVQNYIDVLMGVAPTLHAEQANKGSWMDTLSGILNIAGSAFGIPGIGSAVSGIGGMFGLGGSSGSGGGTSMSGSDFMNSLGGYSGPTDTGSMSTADFMSAIDANNASSLTSSAGDFGNSSDIPNF